MAQTKATKKTAGFAKFKKIDLAIILISVMAWAAANYALEDYFYTMLFLTAALMTSLMLLVRKAGCVSSLFILGGGILILMRQYGMVITLSREFIISFMIMGLAFEAMIFWAPWRYAYVVLASAFAAATIPWTTMLMSGGSIKGLELAMLNFTLSNFFIAAIGSIISLMLWVMVKSSKFIIKLRCNFN